MWSTLFSIDISASNRISSAVIGWKMECNRSPLGEESQSRNGLGARASCLCGQWASRPLSLSGSGKMPDRPTGKMPVLLGNHGPDLFPQDDVGEIARRIHVEHHD